MNTRLLCGTKCTEYRGQCWSYAWNGATKEYMLFSDRCSTDSITDQHQNTWFNYTLQGRVYKEIRVFLIFMSFINFMAQELIQEIYKDNFDICNTCI